MTYLAKQNSGPQSPARVSQEIVTPQVFAPITKEPAIAGRSCVVYGSNGTGRDALGHD